MRFLPVWVVGLLLAVAALLGAQQSLAGVLTATIVVGLLLPVVAAAVATAAVAAPAYVPARSLRRRALVTQGVRDCDPDAAGRPRPRAPSAA